MRRLILRESDGVSLEQMYYAAICIADPERAEKLYRVYRKNEVPPDFWRQAFFNIQYNETALVSAVVNQLSMPFGAYVVEHCDGESIELAPWMYSSKFNREQFISEMFADNVTEETLQSVQRTLELTAAFVYWLNDYEKKTKAGPEA